MFKLKELFWATTSFCYPFYIVVGSCNLIVFISSSVTILVRPLSFHHKFSYRCSYGCLLFHSVVLFLKQLLPFLVCIAYRPSWLGNQNLNPFKKIKKSFNTFSFLPHYICKCSYTNSPLMTANDLNITQYFRQDITNVKTMVLKLCFSWKHVPD